MTVRWVDRPIVSNLLLLFVAPCHVRMYVCMLHYCLLCHCTVSHDNHMIVT